MRGKKDFMILLYFFSAWSIKITPNTTEKKFKKTKINIWTWILCLCRWYLWVLVAKEKKITFKHHSQLKKIHNLSSGTWRHFQFSRIRQIYGFGGSFSPSNHVYYGHLLADTSWTALGLPMKKPKWANNSLWAHADGRKKAGITWFGLTNSFLYDS